VALVVLLFWGVFTHQISVYDAAKILAGALAGKALGKRWEWEVRAIWR